MRNHPHDCPVCDEGGRCLLQEMTMAGGHGIRRYEGKKRTYPDQELGPLVQHEMNRCIHCYRCTRYYREFAGYKDLGAFGIGGKVYFGRRKEGTLESPFAGNLIDICPTGVFTDKPSRFKGRRWDLERSASVCINCSLGCNTYVNARYREIVSVEARYNGAVNGHFICDRGRYGFFHANDKDRPRKARSGIAEKPAKAVMDEVREGITRVSNQYAPEAVAFIGSVRNTLETMETLNWICSKKGWRKPVFWANSDPHQAALTVTERLEPRLSLSLQQVAESDLVLAVGVDPVNDAPMLATAMRQARRNGAVVVVLDPRPVSLPFSFLHIPVPPEEMSTTLGKILNGCRIFENMEPFGNKGINYKIELSGLFAGPSALSAPLSRLPRDIRASKRPAIICGTGITDLDTINVAADFAAILKSSEKKAGQLFLLQGPNAFGGALLADREWNFSDLIENIEKGAVKALVAVESDPFTEYSDPSGLAAAIEKLDLFVAMDYMASATTRRADLFLPTAPHYEAGGLFINNEGRAQRAGGAFKGGAAIAATGGGGHPPREFRDHIEGGEPEAAWLILEELAGICCGHRQMDMESAQKPVTHPHIYEWGFRTELFQFSEKRFNMDWKSAIARLSEERSDLTLVIVDETFGTEELSALSPCLREKEKEPRLLIQSADAEELGFSSGDRVSLPMGEPPVEIALKVVENMAGGVLVLPRHRTLFKETSGIVKMKIEKKQAPQGDCAPSLKQGAYGSQDRRTASPTRGA